MIRNLIDNKVYIGQSLDIHERWKQHEKLLYKGTHHSKYLQNAWNKHGKENFEFSILMECEENKLNEMEQYFIMAFDSYAPYGYNCTYGGNSGRPTEETKQHLSDINKGEKHPKKKAIYCIELKRVFPYARAITEEFGWNHGDVIKCCNGSKLSFHKMHWMYYEDYLEYGEVIREKKTQPKRSHKKKVICIETNVVYESIAEAMRSTGCDSRAIHQCCNNPNRTVKGYHFSYYEENKFIYANTEVSL